ncbi:ABC transporter substrate-binding protein [Streptomyces sp. DSM 44915]|uniref:ABC transporter substrate-binding protein n=1 Tax=Streptomyces chisholmiae TaxID=3075540 RepID=A0ABU2JIM8_9ACTN|nr:ABC transporter substrate-binding protein [Streptomyces sp. DSM 44915]MDT0264843.1 ABC transporter substrate-binding protein [Streptomyces sp. DSM 44915]
MSVLLATTACGSAGADAASVDPDRVGPARGDITWYAINFGPEGFPEQLIAAFERAHPEISVDFQPAPNNTDTMRATLTTEITGGSDSIDVYNGDLVWPAQFGDAQLAMPLDEHLPDDFWDRYPKERARLTEYRDNHLAAPLYVDAGFLYYRKDLLAKHDLPVPRTWQELADTAKRLQDAGDVTYGYVGQWANYEGLTVNWTELSAAAGGRSVTADDAEPAIDSEENRAALDFMRRLLDEGVVPSASTSFQEQQSLQTFVEGDAAFHRNWSHGWDMANDPLASRIADQVGVLPLPGFEGGEERGPSAAGGWNLMVNPHSKQIGAVLVFMDWMTGPEAQRMMAENSVLPASEEVLNDPELQRENPVLEVAADLDLVARPAQTPRYPQISHGIYTNINGSLAGSAPTANALRDAAEDIQRALEDRAL